jgi:hypothetical protein
MKHAPRNKVRELFAWPRLGLVWEVSPSAQGDALVLIS